MDASGHHPGEGMRGFRLRDLRMQASMLAQSALGWIGPLHVLAPGDRARHGRAVGAVLQRAQHDVSLAVVRRSRSARSERGDAWRYVRAANRKKGFA
ncbi:MAG: hypothetical protein ABI780_02805 [Ardenticatenales bacterium]